MNCGESASAGYDSGGSGGGIAGDDGVADAVTGV